MPGAWAPYGTNSFLGSSSGSGPPPRRGSASPPRRWCLAPPCASLGSSSQFLSLRRPPFSPTSARLSSLLLRRPLFTPKRLRPVSTPSSNTSPTSSSGVMGTFPLCSLCITAHTSSSSALRRLFCSRLAPRSTTCPSTGSSLASPRSPSLPSFPLVVAVLLGLCSLLLLLVLEAARRSLCLLRLLRDPGADLRRREVDVIVFFRAPVPATPAPRRCYWGGPVTPLSLSTPGPCSMDTAVSSDQISTRLTIVNQSTFVSLALYTCNILTVEIPRFIREIVCRVYRTLQW